LIGLRISLLAPGFLAFTIGFWPLAFYFFGWPPTLTVAAIRKRSNLPLFLYPAPDEPETPPKTEIPPGIADPTGLGFLHFS
jgi:hypothetical protein